METTVYFIRHGAYVSQGSVLPFRKPGVHVSPLGKKQSEKLREFFADKPITAVYTSPLERCQETAEIIFPNISTTTDERLNEVRCPPIPDEISGWDKFDADWYKKRGGESREEIVSRMKNFLQEKVRAHEGQEIIAVSHGDPILLLLADQMHKHIEEIPYIGMGEYQRLTFSPDPIH